MLETVPRLEADAELELDGLPVASTLTEGDPELVGDCVEAIVTDAELVSSAEGVCSGVIVAIEESVAELDSFADFVDCAENVELGVLFADPVGVLVTVAVDVSLLEAVSVRVAVIDKLLVVVAEDVLLSGADRLDDAEAVGEIEARVDRVGVPDAVDERLTVTVPEDVVVSLTVTVRTAEPELVREADTVRVPSTDPLAVRELVTVCVGPTVLVLDRVLVGLEVNVATEDAERDMAAERLSVEEPVEERDAEIDRVATAVPEEDRDVETERVGVPEPELVREAKGDAVLDFEIGAERVAMDVTVAERVDVIVLVDMLDCVAVREVLIDRELEAVPVLVRLTEGDRVMKLDRVDVEEGSAEFVEDGVPLAVLVGKADCVVVFVRVAELVGRATKPAN